jgi:hypothetical protein
MLLEAVLRPIPAPEAADAGTPDETLGESPFGDLWEAAEPLPPVRGDSSHASSLLATPEVRLSGPTRLAAPVRSSFGASPAPAPVADPNNNAARALQGAASEARSVGSSAVEEGQRPGPSAADEGQPSAQ